MGIATELEKNFDYDMVEEFIGHFQFMCIAMEQLCMNLENPDSYESSINELFRIFHNVKSAASYFQIKPIQNLSTLVESVLEDARICHGKATLEFSRWMSLIADQYYSWQVNLEQDDETFLSINPYILKLPQKLTE